MLPLENLHAVMAILVLFNIFRQVLFTFFDPDSECFVKYDAFLNMRAEDVRLIANKEIRNYEKIAYIKNIFENGRWEDAYFLS